MIAALGSEKLYSQRFEVIGEQHVVEPVDGDRQIPCWPGRIWSAALVVVHVAPSSTEQGAERVVVFGGVEVAGQNLWGRHVDSGQLIELS